MLICSQPGKLFPRAFFFAKKQKKRLQRRAGNPRPTKSRLRVKCSCFTITRGSESPFVHYTQPCGFACQRQKPLGYETERRVIIRALVPTPAKPGRYRLPSGRQASKFDRGFPPVDNSLYSTSFLCRILPLYIYNMYIQSCTKMQEFLPVLPTAKSVILIMYKKTYKERKKKNGKKKDR